MASLSRHIRSTTVALACLALCACSGIPLSSYPKLMQLDPMAANPADIRVAIRTDQSVDVSQIQVLMAVSYQAEDGSFDASYEFEVQAAEAQFLTPALARDAGASDRTMVLQLAPDDARTLHEFQKSVRMLEDSDVEGKGVFSLNVQGFCLPDHMDTEDMELTLFLKTDPDDDFFVFMRQNMQDLLENDETVPNAETLRCDPAAGLQ